MHVNPKSALAKVAALSVAGAIVAVTLLANFSMLRPWLAESPVAGVARFQQFELLIRIWINADKEQLRQWSVTRVQQANTSPIAVAGNSITASPARPA
jgi:hypothetical protein